MKKMTIMSIICLVFSVSLAAKAGSVFFDGKIAIPLTFSENRGQVHRGILYYAKTPSYSIGATKQGLIFADGSMLRFADAADRVSIEPAGQSASKANFFSGNDPKRWITGVNTYPALLYREIYRGIDLKIYGNERDIEYDWIVKPNADPTQIRLCLQNVKEAKLDSEGNLQIETASDRFFHRRPVAYQMIKNKKIKIEAAFKKLERNLFCFSIGEYDPGHELIIDPLITKFATYLGGTGSEDLCYSMAVDNNGHIYFCGSTNSPDFTLFAPFQPSKSSGLDGFICKVDPENSRLLFSTYIGGNGDEWNYRIIVGPDNAIYVIGVTYSTNFPLKDPFQSYNAGDADAFVLKLSPTGDRLLYSTYLGGSYYDSAKGIVVGENGSIYLTGLAWHDFPLRNPIMGYHEGGDNFICKMSANGQSLIFSTYLGGYNYDSGTAIILDNQGAPIVTGMTRSPNYPVVDAWQNNFGGIGDAYLLCADLVEKNLFLRHFLAEAATILAGIFV